MAHSSDGRSLMSFVTTTRARGGIVTSKRGCSVRGINLLSLQSDAIELNHTVLRSIKVLPKVSQGWVLKNVKI
jgi:hypothetical protein